MFVRSYEILNYGDVCLLGKTNPLCLAGSSLRGLIALRKNGLSGSKRTLRIVGVFRCGGLLSFVIAIVEGLSGIYREFHVY